MGQTACFVAARAFPAVEQLAYVDIDCYFARFRQDSHGILCPCKMISTYTVRLKIFTNFANRLHFVQEIFCLHICYTLIYIIYKDGELLHEILMC